MFKKKNKQIKTLPNKSNLDQVLWFIENYLPQKKDLSEKKNKDYKVSKSSFRNISRNFYFT